MASTRIDGADALRGFALLGIGIVNVPLLAGLDPVAVPSAAPDVVAAFVVAALFQGKAFTLFAFLFGWGFGRQCASAAACGTAFGARYARRLLGLLLVGVAHALLVFSGDVLVLYALLGAALWPLRRARMRTLVRLAGASVPVAGVAFAALAIALTEAPVGGAVDPVLGHGFLEATRQRLAGWPWSAGFVLLYNGPLAFGAMCVGLVAARTGFFVDGGASGARLRRALPGLVTAALVSNLAYALGGVGAFGDGLGALLAFASLAFAAPCLAAVYAVAVVEAVRRGAPLGGIAAAGRMTATGYVAQGVLAGAVFGGHGLAQAGRVSEAGCLAVAVALGTLVVVGCAAWSRRVGRGPIEALLRRIADGRRGRAVPTRALVVACGVSIAGCTASGPSGYETRETRFESGGNALAATLNLPRREADGGTPLLVFVHGDGELPADAHGYYVPMWGRLARAGVATLAWDKPGVGDSTGNWLHQSMADRAREVVDAVAHARSPGSSPRFSSVGLIGFSQAGWVVPTVASGSDRPDFAIIVSGAVNWRRQSDWFTRRRLEREGLDPSTIDAAVEQNARDLELFAAPHGYDDYVRHERNKCERGVQPVRCEPMSPDRYRFGSINLEADASEALAQIRVPLLALFGDRDLNVDAEESRATYEQLVPGPDGSGPRTVTYAGATHGLLKAEHFDVQIPGLAFLLTFEAMGEAAFAEGVLDDIVGFAAGR